MRNSRFVAVFLWVLIFAVMIGGCGYRSPSDGLDDTGDDEPWFDPQLGGDREETPGVSEETEASETTEPVPTQPQTYPGYTVAEVNVSTEPNTESEVYLTLMPHSDVEILGLADGWYQVALDEGVFYIHSDYVREKAEPNGYVIAIDAGHQRNGNFDKEPLGPGSGEMKYKVSSGTQGRFTGLPEYELNLMVALKLQRELEYRGYEVIMIRTEHDVNISNAERAAVANEAGADAFIRIHANGSDDPSVHGALTICQTPSNPYNGSLYTQSYALSDAVLDELVAATGCKKLYVWETDTMTGINWCQVPVTIVEMGFMTNQTEDELMATESYQYRMVQGIANGIDSYIFGEAE